MSSVTGGGGNPYVFFTLGTDLNRECLKPAGTDPQLPDEFGHDLAAVGIDPLLQLLDRRLDPRCRSHATCGGTTATANPQCPDLPQLRNQFPRSQTASPGPSARPPNDGLTTETTSVVFASIAQGAIAMLDLTEQATSPVYATVTSCSTSDGTDILNPVWSRPWVP
jgi:hypothetical protein